MLGEINSPTLLSGTFGLPDLWQVYPALSELQKEIRE